MAYCLIRHASDALVRPGPHELPSHSAVPCNVPATSTRFLGELFENLGVNTAAYPAPVVLLIDVDERLQWLRFYAGVNPAWAAPGRQLEYACLAPRGSAGMRHASSFKCSSA